ncbi:hypothetical protein SAMN05442782_8296 [Streptomyces sp. OK228]|nr:hypothetical protein SAMN05442782_8296 [Streptomyces sp. OK228]
MALTAIDSRDRTDVRDHTDVKDTYLDHSDVEDQRDPSQEPQ